MAERTDGAGDWIKDGEAERARLMSQPVVVEELADGSVRVRQGNVVGVGPDREAAVRDLSAKMWVTISRPPL